MDQGSVDKTLELSVYYNHCLHMDQGSVDKTLELSVY